jgi:hypothetical protein
MSGIISPSENPQGTLPSIKLFLKFELRIIHFSQKTF